MAGATESNRKSDPLKSGQCRETEAASWPTKPHLAGMVLTGEPSDLAFHQILVLLLNKIIRIFTRVKLSSLATTQQVQAAALGAGDSLEGRAQQARIRISSDSPVEAWVRAIDQCEGGDISDDAIALLEGALARFPRQIDLLCRLARVKAQRGNWGPSQDASNLRHLIPFSELANGMRNLGEQDQVQISYQALIKFIRHTLRFVPFDEHFYRMVNSGFDSAYMANDRRGLASHYEQHGYFEGRPSELYHFPEIENEPISNPIPDKYFDYLKYSQDYIYEGRPDFSKELLSSAVSLYSKGFYANYNLANILFRGFDYFGSLRPLTMAISLRPHHEAALISFKCILNTLNDDSLSQRCLQELLSYNTSVSTILMNEMCRVELSLRNYARTRQYLSCLQKRNLPPYAQSAVEHIRARLILERQQLSVYRTRIRSGDMTTGERLLALLQLARFGWPKLSQRLLQDLLEQPDFFGQLYQNELQTFIELYEVIFGIEAALNSLENLMAITTLPITDLVVAKIALLSRAGAYSQLIDYCISLKDFWFDDKCSSMVALAMLSEKSYKNLIEFCRHWDSRIKNSISCYYYSLMATILTGDIRTVYLDRSIICRQLISKEIGYLALNESSKSLIPRNIVQYWDKPVPPDDICELLQVWAEQFGPAQYRLFNDNTAREFIRANFGDDTVSLYEFCYHPAMKADLFRLLYLYKEGGYYVDADDGYMPGFTWLIDRTPGAKLVVVTGQQEHNGGRQHLTLNNLFIGAVSEHVVIGAALTHALTLLRAAMNDGKKPGIWATTGPGALTQGLKEVLMASDAERLAILKDIYIYDGTAHFEFVAQAKPLHYKSTIEGNWGKAEI